MCADLKRPRALNVYSAIGQVQLSLEFDNGVNKTFSVSPIQVSARMRMTQCDFDY